MKRKTFDMLLSAGGLVVVAVLIVAGSLLTWGTHYINSNVHNQLAAQQIFFPPAAAFATPRRAPRSRQHDPLSPQIRRPAVDHRRPSWGLRESLHCRAPLRDAVRRRVCESECRRWRTRRTPQSLARSPRSLRERSFEVCCLRLGLWSDGANCRGRRPRFVHTRGIMLILVGFGLLHYRRFPQSKSLAFQQVDMCRLHHSPSWSKSHKCKSSGRPDVVIGPAACPCKSDQKLQTAVGGCDQIPSGTDLLIRLYGV